MGKFNRRWFLKTGIAGAAGVAVLSTELANGKPSKQEKKGDESIGRRWFTGSPNQ